MSLEKQSSQHPNIVKKFSDAIKQLQSGQMLLMFETSMPVLSGGRSSRGTGDIQCCGC